MACADDFIESFPDKYNTYIEQGGTNVSRWPEAASVYRKGSA